jgi:hypothetical protein
MLPIVLVTLSTPDIALYAAKSEVNKIRYCRKHGYGCAIYKDVLDANRPASWSKILALKEVFAAGKCDWCFWIDADAIITNSEIRLETIIDEEYDLIVSQDINGINFGVFLIKNTPGARQFLDAVYAQTQHIHNPIVENAAVREVIAKELAPMCAVKVESQRRFNSCLYGLYYYPPYPEGDFQRGDFVLHLPAASGEVRNALFTAFGKILGHPRTREELHTYVEEHCSGPLVGAEVGVREGIYAKYLLDHIDFRLFYCIDAWRHLPDYTDISNVSDAEHECLLQRAMERLSVHDDKTRFVRKLSTEAAEEIGNGTLDFVYIDANHDYAACKQDLLSFYPKMRRGGIMAGHDYLNEIRSEGVYGVKRAVDEFVECNRVSDFLVTPEPWPTWILKL